MSQNIADLATFFLDPVVTSVPCFCFVQSQGQSEGHRTRVAPVADDSRLDRLKNNRNFIKIYKQKIATTVKIDSIVKMMQHSHFSSAKLSLARPYPPPSPESHSRCASYLAPSAPLRPPRRFAAFESRPTWTVGRSIGSAAWLPSGERPIQENTVIIPKIGKKSKKSIFHLFLHLLLQRVDGRCVFAVDDSERSQLSLCRVAVFRENVVNCCEKVCAPVLTVSVGHLENIRHQ